MNMFDMKENISTILSRDNNNILVGGGGAKTSTYEIFKMGNPIS